MVGPMPRKAIDRSQVPKNGRAVDHTGQATTTATNNTADFAVHCGVPIVFGGIVDSV
jgi:hypothetical protein